MGFLKVRTLQAKCLRLRRTQSAGRDFPEPPMYLALGKVRQTQSCPEGTHILEQEGGKMFSVKDQVVNTSDSVMSLLQLLIQLFNSAALEFKQPQAVCFQRTVAVS